MQITRKGEEFVVTNTPMIAISNRRIIVTQTSSNNRVIINKHLSYGYHISHAMPYVNDSTIQGGIGMLVKRNGWYEGVTLGNRNVPRDNVYVYGSSVTMSGEIITTYYAQYYNPPHPKYGRWSIWKVGDWKGDKPKPTNYKEIEKLRGR